MTAQEFSTRLSEIDSQMTSLETERSKIIQDQMARIRKDLKDIGLVYGTEVDIIDGGIERHCTFNDVRHNGDYIYLEFTYPHEVGEGFYWNEMVDPTNDFLVILPEASFSNKKFMSNYQ